MKRLVGLAVLLFAAHRCLAPMAETDLFFHLKLGDVILAQHRIPFRNLFSFTYPNQPENDLSWLFQVTVSLLYRLGGLAAIVVFKTVLVVAAIALVQRMMRRDGIGPLAAAAACVVAVLAMQQRLVERPHLVSFVGIAATLAILSDIERGRTRMAWLLPAVTLVWAQFHAGVFFAPLLVGSYLFGPARRPLAIVLGPTALATVLTPAGLRLFAYLGWHTGLGSSRDIEEFRHAEPWSDPWFFTMIALAVIALLALRRRTRVHRVLPVVVVGVLAARSVRFVAEWALIAAPLVGAGLDVLVRALRVESSRPLAGAAAAAMAATIGLERLGMPVSLGMADDLVPREAIAFVTRTGLRKRMYCDLDVGCYLLWEGWPRWQVFQDARLPAYPDEFHRALDRTPPAEWDALMRRHGVDAALVNAPGTNLRAGSFDPDEWALVFRTRDAIVLARRTPAHQAIIASQEIPLRIRVSYTEGNHVEPIVDPPAKSPLSRCQWDRRLAAALYAEANPDAALDARARALEHGCLGPAEEADVRFYLGARLQLRGDVRAAAAEYDRVLVLSPDHVDALVNRGYARRALGDAAGADADFARAKALRPGR